RAAEHAESVGALHARLRETGCGPVHRLIPRRGPKAAVVPNQRLRQAMTANVHVARLALLSVRLHELADAVEPQLELVLGLGVREPDEPLPRLAERGARQHGDAGLVQQARREVALVEAGALDVRERVKRALRQFAAHARELVCRLLLEKKK